MTKMVGSTPIRNPHRAACHCGSVVLELDLPEGLVDPLRCDCSMCRRKGTVVAFVPRQGLRVVQGESALAVYRFHTGVARHWFCSRCGIHTHHQRRSNPEQYAFNVGCLDGVDPFALEAVRLSQGSDHPLDRARAMRPAD